MSKIDVAAFRRVADAGLTLIPLRLENGKAPAHKAWTTRPYFNDDTLQLAEKLGCNLGVRLTAEHLILDVDPRNGGTDSLAKLSKALGIDLPSWTPATRTGSGGLHLWMRKPADMKVAGKIDGYPGIDIKTVGGQVVAPGSIHPDTKKPYVLDDPFDELGGIPDLPPGLSDLIQKHRTSPDRSEAPRGEHTSPEGRSDASGSDLWSMCDDDELADLLEKLDPQDFASNDAWFPILCACHHLTGGSDGGRMVFLEWCARDGAFADRSDEVGGRWDSLDRAKGDATTGRTLLHLLLERGLIEPGFRLRAEAEADLASLIEGAEEDAASIAGPLGVTSKGTVADEGKAWEPQVLKNGQMQNNFTNALGAVRHGGLLAVFDEFRQTVTFTNEKLPWPMQHGRLLNDVTARHARLFMLRKYSYGPNEEFWNYQPTTENVWDALLTIAERRVVNPLTDWLSSLQWDGVPRVESLFPQFFKTADDAYTRAVSRCFMVGAVKRAYEPGCKFDTMPVLKGKQGKSKSTGVKALFGADWFSDAEMNLRDKDAAVMLLGKWVHEFAELEGMTRGEVSTMKAFFSRGEDRLRPAYGRSVISLPRRCIFVGTVNEGGYLRDQTGNRRYWPLEVGGPDGEQEVDVEGLKANRDQLWAEAVALYRAGASEILDRGLWDMARERQMAETTEDPWADDIRRFLAARAETYNDWKTQQNDFAPEGYRHGEAVVPLPYRVHTSELLDELAIVGSSRNTAQAGKLSTVMESIIGWKKREIRIPGNKPDRAKGYFDPANDPNLG